MKIELKDFNDLAFYAFRYALGRKSYCTADVSNLLIKYAQELYHPEKYVNEINIAIKSDDAGMDCDVAGWVKCRNKLLEQL